MQKGKITLSLEDSEEMAHFYGKQQLLYPKTRSVEEYLKEIEAVEKSRVNALATRLLKPEELLDYEEISKNAIIKKVKENMEVRPQ